MHSLENSFRSLGIMFQLGADRLFVLLAILVSLFVAANIGLQLMTDQIPASIGFY